MDPTITKCISLIILSLLLKHQTLTQAQQQVPCMFLFGDSQFDNGNNNPLISLLKVNYQPYGIDFPDGPTGRASNGQLIPDFLAEFLGFDTPISPFVSVRGSAILRGVNYGSGGSGILEETGASGGGRFTMNRQLGNHQLIIDNMILLFENNQTALNNYLNKCLYVVYIGNNDYLNNYYSSQSSNSRMLYTPDRFTEILIQKLNQQLRTIHNSGARKITVFGLGPLGCVLQMRAKFPTNGSVCVDFINNSARMFNNRLTSLIDNLNTDLGDSQFTFINVTNIALGDSSLAGVTFTNVSCCVTQNNTGLCVPDKVPCSNRSDYIFWDNYHPSEIALRATATRSYTALLPADTYPVDIRSLVQQ